VENLSVVMAGLLAGHPRLSFRGKKDVDVRDNPAHETERGLFSGRMMPQVFGQQYARTFGNVGTRLDEQYVCP
jgi:hypothetical protein